MSLDDIAHAIHVLRDYLLRSRGEDLVVLMTNDMTVEVSTRVPDLKLIVYRPVSSTDSVRVPCLIDAHTTTE